MNEQLVSLMRQKGKNLTLLIVVGGVVSAMHAAAAEMIMGAVCLAVSAPFVAENWPRNSSTATDTDAGGAS